MKTSKTTFKFIKAKALDGKVFETYISFVEGHGWDINENQFFRSSKKETEQAARAMLLNDVEEYEFDNNLR